MRTVLVPPVAGLFSAVGLLFARPEFHEVRTCHLDVDAVDPGRGRGALRRDGGQARATRSRGAPRSSGRGRADLRYGGQSWEVEVGCPAGPIDAACSRRCVARFEDEHERLYGVKDQAGSPVEIRALRLAALGEAAATRSFQLDGANGAGPDGASRRSTSAATTSTRRCGTRSSIGEAPEPGPLLVDEYDTTVVVPPGWSARRDAATGTLVLERARWRLAARVDPITLQIVGNALASIADEMATTICRTAHSTVVRDGMDFSAVVCDAEGQDGRAGGHVPVPPRLDPGRDGDAARALRRADPARATSS